MPVVILTWGYYFFCQITIHIDIKITIHTDIKITTIYIYIDIKITIHIDIKITTNIDIKVTIHIDIKIIISKCNVLIDCTHGESDGIFVLHCTCTYIYYLIVLI